MLFGTAKAVDLSSEKIELANIKDVPKHLKRIFDGQRKLDKSVPQLEKLTETVDKQRSNLRADADDASKALSEIEKKAKDLGISTSEIPDFKQLQTEISNTKSEYL